MRLAVPTRNRPVNWSKEQVLLELPRFGTIKALCTHFAGKEHWRGLYADIWRWKNPDSPDFDQKFSDSMTEWMEANNVTSSGGRPKRVVDPSWKEQFRRNIVKYNGNRVKAAEGMPYALDSIVKMLSEGASEFDKELHEQVGLAYFELAAKAEEAAFNTLDALIEDPTPEQAKVSQATGWLATKLLETVDSTRWGRKTQVNLKGKIQHELVASDNVIARLSAHQQRHFGPGATRSLPAAPEVIEDNSKAIEAEYVETSDE